MATPNDTDGPSLQTYVETRFNLLVASMQSQAAFDAAALAALAESSKAAALAAKDATEAARVSTDLRYQQRFEAQSDALGAAFASQQQAMQTAFVVAEKAVQAALAAADRAVSKAELAADKRFEALNELRQMLNEMVNSLMPRTEASTRFGALAEKLEALSSTASTVDSVAAIAARVEQVEGRLNIIAGQTSGARRQGDDTRGLWSVAIAVIAVLVAVAALFLR